MPAYALQLVIAALLVGLTFLVHYPLSIAEGKRIDALDAFLLVMALVNLRLAWSAANAGNGGKAPAWFTVAGLLLAGFIRQLPSVSAYLSQRQWK